MLNLPKSIMREIVIIAAIAQNGVIGKDNDLPWGKSYPEDLAHFKALTLNQTVVMGRNTYESILNKLKKPLPNRHNVVVTSRDIEGVETAHSLYEIMKSHDEDLYVIGGQRLYEVALPLASCLELTHILKDYEGDTYFPEIGKEWKTISERHSGELLFRTYLRG